MEALPKEIVRVLRVFEDVFSERVWDWVQVLVVGAILTPGQRTVAAVLRVMGLSDERQFQNYHRVLNRARWSSRAVSRRLLGVLVATFVPIDGPVVVGLDETIERRRGAKIAAKGIYRDPVRSSKSHFVKTSGLRWITILWRTCWRSRRIHGHLDSLTAAMVRSLPGAAGGFVPQRAHRQPVRLPLTCNLALSRRHGLCGLILRATL